MAKSRTQDPQQYTLPNGQSLACVVCDQRLFEQRKYKLNTTGMEYAGWAWANRNATCLICVNCRHIHWFAA